MGLLKEKCTYRPTAVESTLAWIVCGRLRIRGAALGGISDVPG